MFELERRNKFRYYYIWHVPLMVLLNSFLKASDTVSCEKISKLHTAHQSLQNVCRKSPGKQITVYVGGLKELKCDYCLMAMEPNCLQ